MDVLSDILRSVRLGGGVYFRCEFSAPWGMEIQPTPVAEFHVIVRGNCWLRMAGQDDPILLQGGDLVAFPHGDAHRLLDNPSSPSLPAGKIIEGQDLTHYGPVTHGGGGLPASVLCGYFELDRERPHPLVTALPSLVHIRGTDGEQFVWLQTTINFMIHETRAARPGAEAAVSRLAEVLFVQLVRAYVDQTGATAGMFAAIADRQIGKALERIHEAPAEPWTLESLAQRAGMSRSAFAARFSQLVGQTAMQYLAFWRMQKARELLDQTPLSAGTVAERVGYQSEAAFARAFKTVVGLGPGAYRRRRQRK